jgi:hypothetical protein
MTFPGNHKKILKIEMEQLEGKLVTPVNTYVAGTTTEVSKRQGL